MKTEKKIWYWVTGSEKNGFRVVTKRPRTKHVNEPHPSRELAQRWIAMYFLENA